MTKTNVDELKELANSLTNAFVGELISKEQLAKLHAELIYEKIPSKLTLITDVSKYFMLLDDSQNYCEVTNITMIYDVTNRIMPNIGHKNVMNEVTEKIGIQTVEESILNDWKYKDVTDSINTGVSLITEIERHNASINHNSSTNPISNLDSAKYNYNPSVLMKYIPAIEEIFLKPILD